MVFPNQADHYGTLFAGEALRLMDKAALVAASRHASGDGEFRAERFSRTGAAGQIAEVVGRVSKAGRSSVAVEVELGADGGPRTIHERQLCAGCGG